MPLSCDKCRCGSGISTRNGRRAATGWLVPVAALALTLTALVVVDARGEVFHSRESALRLAFDGADSVNTRTLVLDGEQVEAIEGRSGSRVPSRVVRAYVGYRDDTILGYAFIETHRVRSLPETVMVVVAPDGSVAATHLLAFHEPPQYRPPQRWLDQFDARPLDDRMALGRDIAGIAGSTLTAQAVTACVRRAAATAEVCLVTPATAVQDAPVSKAGTP